MQSRVAIEQVELPDHLDDRLLAMIEYNMAEGYACPVQTIHDAVTKVNSPLSSHQSPLLLAESLYWSLSHNHPLAGGANGRVDIFMTDELFERTRRRDATYARK